MRPRLNAMRDFVIILLYLIGPIHFISIDIDNRCISQAVSVSRYNVEPVSVS